MQPLLAEPSGPLTGALAILSAMITPAVLILASSSLIAATSTRLGRVLDRSRKLAEQLEALMQSQASDAPAREKFDLLVDQLQKNARRALLLQRAMTALCVALGAFVATSIALGIAAALGRGQTTLLAVLGLVGAASLFYASVLLVAESHLAIAAIHRELEFISRLAVVSGSKQQLAQAQQKAAAP